MFNYRKIHVQRKTVIKYGLILLIIFVLYRIISHGKKLDNIAKNLASNQAQTETFVIVPIQSPAITTPVSSTAGALVKVINAPHIVESTDTSVELWVMNNSALTFSQDGKYLLEIRSDTVPIYNGAIHFADLEVGRYLVQVASSIMSIK